MKIYPLSINVEGNFFNHAILSSSKKGGGFTVSLSTKIHKAKELIISGHYKEFAIGILSNIMKKESYRDLVYLHLKRKYSAFIEDRVAENLRNSGENKTAETPNTIWWLWLQGEDNAPDICKACLRSLRRWHSDKKIITLDSQNLHEYITFPDYINEAHEKEIMSHTHYSDLVRLQLLAEYGGTWADATIFCTGRKFENVMHLPLFVFKRDSTNKSSAIWSFSSWFMVSAPHDPIVTLARDLIFQYWQDYYYLMHYFLINMLFKIAADKYSDEWDQIPFLSERPPHEMQHSMYEEYTEEKMKYFRDISDFHKLTWKLNPEQIPSDRSIYHHIVHDE